MEIFLDDYNGKIVLPIDDVKETVAILQCFQNAFCNPINIFIQLPELHHILEKTKGGNDEGQVTRVYNKSGILQTAEELERQETMIRSLVQRKLHLMEALRWYVFLKI